MFSKRFYFLITSAVFASPVSVFAAVEAEITKSSPVPVPEWAAKGFLDFLGWLFPVMIAGAALIATLSIIFAGFQWMAGAISPPQVESAKNRISAAVLGLAVALGSWLILNTINPAFTQLKAPVGFTLQCPGGVCPSWTDVLFGVEPDVQKIIKRATVSEVPPSPNQPGDTTKTIDNINNRLKGGGKKLMINEFINFNNFGTNDIEKRRQAIQIMEQKCSSVRGV